MGPAFSCMRHTVFQNPEVKLQAMWVQKLSLTGGTLIILLHVYNPNLYPIHITTLRYKTCKTSDGTTIAEGTLKDSFHIPPQNSTTAKIDSVFTYMGLGAVGKSLGRRGKVSYTVSGVLTVGGVTHAGDHLMVPFSEQGEFSLIDKMRDIVHHAE